jgi:hypothetical protein
MRMGVPNVRQLPNIRQALSKLVLEGVKPGEGRRGLLLHAFSRKPRLETPRGVASYGSPDRWLSRLCWVGDTFHEQAWLARRDTCEASAEGGGLWHAFCSATKLRDDMPRHTYGLLEEETCPWSALMT